MSDIDTATVSGNPAPATTGAPATSTVEKQPASPSGPADTAVSGQTTEGGGTKPEPTRDRRAEKRIASLTRKHEEAQQQIGYWRGIAEAKNGQPQATSAASEPVKPQPNQFKTYDEYVEALTDWKTDQRFAKHTAEQQRRSEVQQNTSKADEVNSRVAERLAEDGADIEDFDDVMEIVTAKGFPISASMRDYLSEADHPAHVAQFLADNRGEARKIYGMNSAAAVRALDKIAAQVAPKSAKGKTSSAPAPVPTVRGQSVTAVDVAKQSMDEYAAAWRKRQNR